MVHLVLVLLYVLVSLGFVVGTLSDANTIPNVAKVLMIIFSPFLAPLFLGAGLGMIITDKINKH